jgi:hypothetical protein
MTLVLDLPVEVEVELRETAAARGMAVEAVAVERLRAVQGPQANHDLDALNELLSLGARLTQGTEPLAADAVARSYTGSIDDKVA